MGLYDKNKNIETEPVAFNKSIENEEIIPCEKACKGKYENLERP